MKYARTPRSRLPSASNDGPGKCEKSSKSVWPSLWEQISPEGENQNEPNIGFMRGFFSRLDIHGIGSIAGTPQVCLRLVWVFILLGALLFLLVLLYGNITEYIQNPVVTNMDLVAGQPVKFPEIYICPTNYINQSYVLMTGLNLSWATYFRSGASLNLSENVQAKNDLLNLKQGLWDTLMPPPPPPPTPLVLSMGMTISTIMTTTTAPPPPPPPPNFQDYFLQLGYQTQEFLKECSFQSQPMDCADVTEEIFDRDHGKCFLLRLNRSQTRPGEGLSLVLDIHTELYPQAIAAEPPIFDGVYLAISHRFQPASYDQILLPPGAYTRIGLEATKITRVSGIGPIIVYYLLLFIFYFILSKLCRAYF